MTLRKKLLQTVPVLFKNGIARQNRSAIPPEDAPLRGELLSVDQLVRHAKSLATEHRSVTTRSPNRLLARLDENERILREYNRATHAVMLASPADLEDFAVGFSLAEGIIAHPADLLELEIVAVPDGIEARMTLDPARLDALTRRQRRLAGPSGCGLCGLDSLRDAIRHAVATHRLNSVQQIGVLLRAGTNCGSCIPELQEILRNVRMPAD